MPSRPLLCIVVAFWSMAKYGSIKIQIYTSANCHCMSDLGGEKKKDKKAQRAARVSRSGQRPMLATAKIDIGMKIMQRPR